MHADHHALLDDFLAGDRGLLTLCQEHGITLDDLARWADSPRTRADLDTITRLADLRAHAIAAQARIIALSRLASAAAAAPIADHGHDQPAGHRALQGARSAVSLLARLLIPPRRQARPSHAATGSRGTAALRPRAPSSGSPRRHAPPAPHISTPARDASTASPPRQSIPPATAPITEPVTAPHPPRSAPAGRRASTLIAYAARTPPPWHAPAATSRAAPSGPAPADPADILPILGLTAPQRANDLPGARAAAERAAPGSGRPATTRSRAMSTDRIDGAVACMRAFIDANDRQDPDAMKACLTRQSREEEGFSGPAPGEVTFRMGEPEDQGDHVIVPIHVFAPGDENEPVDQLRCIVVEEEGAWKFDLIRTLAPQMEAVEQALGEAMGQIGEAMGQAFSAIGDAFTDAFGPDPSAPSTWEHVDLAPDQEELRTLDALEILPKATQALSDALGRHIPCTCDLQGFMNAFGSLTSDAMLAMVDDVAVAALAQAMADLAPHYPLFSRIRAVRIEPAQYPSDRAFLADGPDLVYRFNPRSDQGVFSPGEIATALPGAVAALAESHDGWPEGMSILPPRYSDVDRDRYRRTTAARMMRRIAACVRGPVALDAPWHDFERSHAIVPTLAEWSLNRVVGGLELARADGLLDNKDDGWLSTVRIEFVDEPAQRDVSLSDGVLRLAVCPDAGEPGSVSEYDIYGVLDGQVFEPRSPDS